MPGQPWKPIHTPALEALGGRVSRNLERLTGAIAAAALVIGGAMLVLALLLIAMAIRARRGKFCAGFS